MYTSKSPRRLRGTLAAAVVVLTGAAGLALLWAGEGHDHGHGGGGAGAADPKAPRVISDVSRRTLSIQTAPVMRRPIDEVVRAIGTVQARSDAHVRVGSPVAGRVREVKVSVGDAVKSTDDVLVVIESVEAAKLQTALTVQAGRRREAKSHLEETRGVARRLAVLELANLYAQLAVADDGLRAAEASLELVKKGGAAVARREVLTAELDHSRAAVLVQTLEARFSASGVPAEVLVKLRRAAPRTDVTRLLAEGTIKWEDVSVLGKPLEVLEREHEQIELAAEIDRLSREVRILGFDEATVQGLIEGKIGPQPLALRSSLVGAVSVRGVAVGQMIQPDHALLEVVNTARVRVETEVPEGLFARIISHRPTTARVHATATAGGVLEGRIVSISPRIDPVTRTARLTVEVDNPEGRLLIGTFVEVSIVLRRVKEAITVPRDAVVRQGPVTFVWVETRSKDEWKYEGRDVTVGATDDRYAEIVAGDLAPGVHTVVVRGAYQLTLIGGGGDPHAGHDHEH